MGVFPWKTGEAADCVEQCGLAAAGWSHHSDGLTGLHGKIHTAQSRHFINADTLARQSQTTLFTTLLSTFQALMHRWCRQDDLVVGCPLVRENDGLAMSSRNSYLEPDERAAATVLAGALYLASEAVVAGERDPATLRRLLVDIIARVPLVRLDYAEVVDGATLEPIDEIGPGTLVALAAFVGKARLIDNVTISFSGGTATPDLGVVTASSGMQEGEH